MKEAIANAGIFNLVIIFVIILIAFFIGSLSYSKAFKVSCKAISSLLVIDITTFQGSGSYELYKI